MVDRVQINPEILRWALARSHRARADFPKVDFDAKTTVALSEKAAQKLAKDLYIPFGYLFLNTPPREDLGVADFRQFAGSMPQNSANLIDTLYAYQSRQAWYRDYLQRNGLAEIKAFIGCVDVTHDPVEVAAKIRQWLGYSVGDNRKTAGGLLPEIIRKLESLGILVMYSGKVGDNTRRILNTNEFCGFALVDNLAPLVFVNARLAKTAQLFTLIHEVAHLWLGEGGISNIVEDTGRNAPAIEQWCNAVAAEFLVPESVQAAFTGQNVEESLAEIIRRCGVSRQVALLRLKKWGVVSRGDFEVLWQEATQKVSDIQSGSGGGDYYNNAFAALGRLLPQSIIIDALEGKTFYREAMGLLGVKKSKTFHAMSEKLNIPTQGYGL